MGLRSLISEVPLYGNVTNPVQNLDARAYHHILTKTKDGLQWVLERQIADVTWIMIQIKTDKS